MNISFVWKAAIVIGLGVVGLASRFIFKMRPDNQIEECAEYIIEQQIGRKIDLSPDTPDGDVNAAEMIRDGQELAEKLKKGRKSSKL